MHNQEKDLYYIYTIMEATASYLLMLFVNHFTISNMKITGLKGSVKAFSVNFNPIDTNDILTIHRYFIKGT